MTRKLKPKRKSSVAKRQPPKWKRERSISLLIWITIPIVILFALGLVGYWAYDNYVAAWSKPVAKINETVLDMDYFVKMLRFHSRVRGDAINTVSFPYEVLRIIEDDELVRQAAEEFDIRVPPTDVTETIQGNATELETEADEQYQGWLDRIQLSDNEYRQIIEGDLLNQKLREHFREHEVPEEAKHVHLHTILLDTEEAALEALDRLNNGEDFASLAVELSQDEASKGNGGDLSWVPQGIYPELDEVAFSLEVGSVSEPIPTLQGYSLIKVSEVAESRPLEEQHREVLAVSVFEDWLQAERAAKVTEYVDQDMMTWAIDRIG